MNNERLKELQAEFSQEAIEQNQKESRFIGAIAYIQGQVDSRDGLPHRIDMGPYYDDGYSNQVWHDEQETARSMGNGSK